MNKNSFFAFISRMKHINRWGLMHNSRYENLSEHSFETAYLANALANIENTMFGGKYDVNYITACALFHDCAEIITGDLPTPVKYMGSEMESAYKAAEQKANDTLLSGLPEQLRGIYSGYISCSDDAREIIKAADKLSALIKCIEETTLQNRDFESALQSTKTKLESSTLRSVRYFTDNILPCYTLNLDELSEV